MGIPATDSLDVNRAPLLIAAREREAEINSSYTLEKNVESASSQTHLLLQLMLLPDLLLLL